MGDRQIAEMLRRLLFFSFLFCAGRWDDSGLYLFYLFYDLLVSQFQIIPCYPSEFNFTRLLFL